MKSIGHEACGKMFPDGTTRRRRGNRLAKFLRSEDLRVPRTRMAGDKSSSGYTAPASALKKPDPIRSVCIWLWSLALCFAFGMGVAAGDSSPGEAVPVLHHAMADPLLGLSYDPNKVRFDTVSKALAREADLGDEPQWIYARCVEGSDVYLIVAGWQRVEHDDGNLSADIEPDFGAVLRQHGENIEVLGVPDRLFDQDALLPAATTQSLMRDAARRFVRAWGSAGALQSVLHRQLRTDSFPDVLRDAFHAEGLHLPAAQRPAALSMHARALPHAYLNVSPDLRRN